MASRRSRPRGVTSPKRTLRVVVNTRPDEGNGAKSALTPASVAVPCNGCDTPKTLPNERAVGSLALVRARSSLLVTVAAVVIVSVLGGWWWSRSSDDTYELETTTGSIALNKVAEGSLFASVDLQTATGARVSTDTLIGQPLIVNFWFSTCEPCRREFPVLVDAHGQYGERIRFIGVNLSDSAETATAFTDQFGATFETFFDRDGRLTSALGVATAPVTMLVDAGGVVRRQLTGEITAESLTAAIREVFPS